MLLGTGPVMAVQARLNAELAHQLGNSVQSSALSVAISLVPLSIAIMCLASLRRGLRAVPLALRSRRLPWWVLIAGVLGASYLIFGALSVTVGGVALFAVAMVAGQATSAVVADRIGASPLGRIPVSARRIVSAGLAIAAVALATSSHLNAAGFSVAGVVLGFAAGVVVPFQQALNGRTTAVTGQPFVAVWVNNSVGLAVMGLASLIGILALQQGVRWPVSGPWWMWLGGPLGLIWVGMAAWSAARFGVLLLTVVAVAGQLAMSLVVDIVAPIGTATVDLVMVLGVLITFAAVAVATWRRV